MNRGDSAVRRNIPLRGSDMLFRIGQLARTGSDGEIAAHGRGHLMVLHRAVCAALDAHAPDADGACVGCQQGRRRRVAHPCAVRKAILATLAEGGRDDR